MPLRSASHSQAVRGARDRARRTQMAVADMYRSAVHGLYGGNRLAGEVTL